MKAYSAHLVRTSPGVGGALQLDEGVLAIRRTARLLLEDLLRGRQRRQLPLAAVLRLLVPRKETIPYPGSRSLIFYARFGKFLNS